jgi:hypothetical protein
LFLNCTYAKPNFIELVESNRSQVGPRHVSKQTEDSSEVEAMGLHEAVREQVETQVSVGSINWLSAQVFNHRGDDRAGGSSNRV